MAVSDDGEEGVDGVEAVTRREGLKKCVVVWW